MVDEIPSALSATNPTFDPDTVRYTPGISERRDSTSRFLHSGIENADARTTTGTSVEAERSYDAFGKVISSSGIWQGFFGYAGGFGYQEEPDTGLKLLGHRYYDSATGRFLSRDPIGSGRNWYGYCSNNPASFYDNDGLQEMVIPGDPNELLRNGWKRDLVHQDPYSERYVAPNGEQAIEYTKGQPGKPGYRGIDHCALYEKDSKGKWIKQITGPRKGHLFPGDKVKIRSKTGTPSRRPTSGVPGRMPPPLLRFSLILGLIGLAADANGGFSCTDELCDSKPGTCQRCGRLKPQNGRGNGEKPSTKRKV